jgi:hypothetical protein
MSGAVERACEAHERQLRSIYGAHAWRPLSPCLRQMAHGLAWFGTSLGGLQIARVAARGGFGPYDWIGNSLVAASLSLSGGLYWLTSVPDKNQMAKSLFREFFSHRPDVCDRLIDSPDQLDPMHRLAWLAYGKGLMLQVLDGPSRLSVEARLGIRELAEHIGDCMVRLSEEITEADRTLVSKGQLMSVSYTARQQLLVKLNSCLMDLDERQPMAVPYPVALDL